MSTVTRKYEWPTREQWAKHQHAFYFDRFENLKIDFELYPEEVASITPVLKAEWLRLGKLLRAEKKLHPQAFRQKGEKGWEWYERWRSLPREDQDRDVFTRERSQILAAIKCLQDGRLPRYGDEGGYMDCVKEAIAVPLKRWEEAEEAATNKREQEILATPIDDAAWEAELRWRAKIEADAARPASDFIVQC